MARGAGVARRSSSRPWAAALGLGLVLCLLGSLGWWLFGRTSPGAQTPFAPVSAGGHFPTRQPAPGRPPQALATESTVSAAALPDGWIEVCGEAPVELSQIDKDPRFVASLPLDELGAALRSDHDPRRRAAGLGLGIHLQWQAAAHGIAQRVEACGGDAECSINALKAEGANRPTGRGAHLEALARLAATSQDAGVYGLAARLCRAHDDPPTGACRQVSLAEWARKDADNLAPWLHLADAASSAAARAEALHRASLATRHDDDLGVVIDATLPPGLPKGGAVAEMAISGGVFGLWTAQLMPPLGGVIRHCETQALLDGNRLQQCNALAHALVDRGNSHLLVLVGARIGERAGWPADRVADAQAQVAMMQAVQPGQATIERSLSCKGQAAMRQYMADVGQLGEVGAGRAALARASGDQLAQAHGAAQADAARRRAVHTSEAAGRQIPEGAASTPTR